MIGAGWWSQGWHLPQIHRSPDAKIIAIVEPNAEPVTSKTLKVELESTANLAEKYSAKMFNTSEDLIADKETLGKIKGVIIATSHAHHAELGILFLEQGKHVFMEKPMAVDLQDSKILSKTADQNDNLVFMVNHSANFRANCLKSREIVESGDLGEICHVLAVMYSPLLWFFDDSENESWTKPVGSMLGNGFGWGQICHLLAWVHYVADLRSKEVNCIMHHSEKSGADIMNAALVKCENGESISVSAGAFWPGIGVTQDEMSKHFDIKIFGTKGVLSYGGRDTDESSGKLEVRFHDDKKKAFSSEGFKMEDTAPEGLGPASLKNFVHACNGKEYVNGCDQNVGLRVVETISAMYESGKSGKVAKI